MTPAISSPTRPLPPGSAFQPPASATPALPLLLQTSIRLSLPYNHAPDYPEWLDDHAEGVCEVYLPLHGSIVASLRPWVGPLDPADYLQELRRLAAVLNRRGISGNAVINVPVPDRLHGRALMGLREIAEIFEHWTVTLADFHFAKAVRRTFPDLEIGVSTGANVDTAQQAIFWQEGVGVGNIAISRGINKRLNTIRSIRSLGLRVKMVLQDDCIPNCPAELSHYGQTEQCGVPGTGGDCFMQDVRNRSPWLVALKDVVPAELPLYAGIVDVAKLAGRTHTLGRIGRHRRLYLDAVSWDHPAGYFVDSAEAFRKIGACDRNCHQCGWCVRHLKRVGAG